MSNELQADVVAMVPPATGAREIDILSPENPDVTIPVALYQAEKFNAHGVKAAEPSILYRFRPTLEQRHAILQGEDLYLLVLLPNNRAPLPLELTVGPGPLQLEPHSTLLNPHGAPIRGPGPQLWTPEQGA